MPVKNSENAGSSRSQPDQKASGHITYCDFPVQRCRSYTYCQHNDGDVGGVKKAPSPSNIDVHFPFSENCHEGCRSGGQGCTLRVLIRCYRDRGNQLNKYKSKQSPPALFKLT